MPPLAARILLGIFLLYPLSLLGQFTQVTATVVDPNGQPYANCGFTASFVGQNTVPGHPPYTLGGVPGGQFQQQTGGSCTSAAVLSTTLADNNQINPLPSQWEFAVCDQTKRYCFNSLCTVTGTTSDVSACINANAVVLPGGGGPGGITGAVQGQPIYGTGGTTAKSEATELSADAFAGTDICQKIMAAETALPATGGIIRLSAQNYPVCAGDIVINKRNVTLRGAGPGNWGLSEGATQLNFPAGVSGIVGVTGAENMNIEGMYLKSASTGPGTDDGITLIGGSPRIARVIVQGFGRNGIVFQNNTDLWRLENVYADSNKNDGFYWSPGCSDENAGTASGLSATANGNYGYEVQCGGSNNFQTTHASGNLGGAWYVNADYNWFYDVYVENDGHSAFTFASGTAYNTAFFNGFGQPLPLTDLGIASTNTIYYEGAGGSEGQYPAQTTFSLTGAPQHSPGAFYTMYADSGAYGVSDLTMRDRKNGTNLWYYVPTKGWTFLHPLFVGDDSGLSGAVVPGTLTIAGSSALGAHTVVKTQATAATLFNLPATNGTSGQSLTTDGLGNTSWATVSGGPGGGVTSVTGTGTVSCSPTTGAVVCNGTGGGPPGITNSAPANVVTKSDGTNVVSSSLTDNATTVTTTEPLNAATLSTGSGANGCPAVGCWSMAEAPTPGSYSGNLGYDYCRADSNTHSILCSFNGNPEAPLGGSSGAPSFSVITAGTNTAALVMGTGGSLTASGGTIAATSVPASGLGAGTISNNTSGTASNLSGTPALPNGTTATTQTVGDNTTKIATDAFVLANAGSSSIPSPTTTQLIEYFCSGTNNTGNVGNLGWTLTTIGAAPVVAGVAGTYPHRCVVELRTAVAATQNQGGLLGLSPGSGGGGWGDFSTNPGWSIRATFALVTPASSVMRMGISPGTPTIRPLQGMFLVFDTNSPMSAAAISSLTCTTTICTVTMAAASGLVVPGQGFTLAGTSCPNRGTTLNTTYAYGTATGIATISGTTAFTFNSAGATDTCTAATGTVTTNAQVDFGFETINGNNAAVTVIDTGVVADTGWHTFTMSESTAGTIQFKLDSGSTVSVSTNVTTNTTMEPDISIGTDITAQRAIDLNYYSYVETGVSR